ncbi:MAG: prolyl aminopeptidase [Rhodospirillales bacterium]|jgi:proline iminopeptidase|nr:prolyl aminopeptidase [Rhodospirillales bacterium]
MDDQATRRELFPEIAPRRHGMLRVSERHEIYWEESGNADGAPVVFLHGGPGAGSTPAHRRFFDPRHYRIVLFDQRGAGRSRPFAETSENTTQDLVLDMERLRESLGIERWLVFGGSWGATLALAYGIAYPARCTGFVLRGVFLGRRRELDWFIHGIRTVFPEAWRAFTEFLPEDERGDVAGAYWRRLAHTDPAVHLPAARAWSAYENACSALVAKGGSEGAGVGAAPLRLARLECHYFLNAMFMSEGYLLENLGAVRHLPAVIVQGRYDMICPIVTADELARAWPEARFVVVADAGHSAMEPGIREALVAATESLKSTALAPAASQSLGPPASGD